MTPSSGSPLALLGWPSTATRDSLFGSLAAPEVPFELSGLDPTASYGFTIVASRLSVSDARTTRYAATGFTSAAAELDPSNNTSNVATLDATTVAGSSFPLTVNPDALAPGVAAATLLVQSPSLPYEGGSGTTWTVPLSLVGRHFIAQGGVLWPSPITGNPFTTSDAHEVLGAPRRGARPAGPASPRESPLRLHGEDPAIAKPVRPRTPVPTEIPVPTDSTPSPTPQGTQNKCRCRVGLGSCMVKE